MVPDPVEAGSRAADADGAEPERESKAEAPAPTADTEAMPEGHVLLLGVGDLTVPILEELAAMGGPPVVVVTPATDRVKPLTEGAARVIIGDPSDESTQRRAGVEDASAVVVATNDDAADAFAVLTARHLAPAVRIVAAATNQENVDKLELAGANAVVSPATLGGRMLVRSAIDRTGIEDLADQILEVA